MEAKAVTFSSYLKDRWGFWQKARDTDNPFVLKAELAAGFLCFTAIVLFLLQVVFSFYPGATTFLYSHEFPVLYSLYSAVMVSLLSVARIARAKSAKSRLCGKTLLFLFVSLFVAAVLYSGAEGKSLDVVVEAAKFLYALSFLYFVGGGLLDSCARIFFPLKKAEAGLWHPWHWLLIFLLVGLFAS